MAAYLLLICLLRRCMGLVRRSALVAVSAYISLMFPLLGASSHVDNKTLKGKVIVGYQGWFACPSDRSGLKNWGHWQKSDGTLAVDMLPSMVELPHQAGCEAPFITDVAGRRQMLFSSQNPFVVDKHVQWLRQYGISGLAVQSFVIGLGHPATKEARDVVLNNVRQSSERYGTVFFLTYDISGAGPDWLEVVERDWSALAASGILASSSYLHENGKPIVEIWGGGWPDRPATSQQLQDVVDYFMNGAAPGSVIVGVPGNWRKMSGSWRGSYLSSLAISPWTIGNYHSPDEAVRFGNENYEPDLLLAHSHNVLYMPVVFPGYSAANASGGHDAFDSVPRDCGAFIQAQISELKKFRPDAVYVAMFDEANEGTAIMKTSPYRAEYKEKVLPYEGACDATGDLYLRLVGGISRYLTK